MDSVCRLWSRQVIQKQVEATRNLIAVEWLLKASPSPAHPLPLWTLCSRLQSLPRSSPNHFIPHIPRLIYLVTPGCPSLFGWYFYLKHFLYFLVITDLFTPYQDYNTNIKNRWSRRLKTIPEYSLIREFPFIDRGRGGCWSKYLDLP